MHPDDRWHQVERYLDAVLELDPAAQAAYLDAYCPDAGVRRQVEALLKADAEAPAFLDEDALHFASPLFEEDTLMQPERHRVGPYRLHHEVGRGGMGIVYLAEREGLDRQVALKLVRGGLADPTATARFLHERRVLARLEHPNIARLYDVGLTDDGTPYFAMELVEGPSLVDYCDSQRLDIAARLRLFESVGQAVQHAHQHFIVHRDLKPSNILVTEKNTGKARVKLLDFGIAKVLAEAEEVASTPQTETGYRRMTLAYAAPEQIRGEAITAATDVYSLGVVLYELLTGQLPYNVEGTGIDAAQVVLTQEPKRPSTAITRDPSPTTTAQARAATADQLSRRLRGDLDVICLKALAKEPDRRYASAEAFVADIRRHLAGLPVTARPATVGYRLRKFVRRHRPSLLAGTAVVVVLACVVAYYTNRLHQERDTAQIEARKAEQVAAFMAGLFTVSNPWEEVQGDTLRAGDLLERGAARIETELADEPEVQAKMMHTIGEVYDQLGLYDRATALLERALLVQREVLGETHPEVALTLRTLGRLAYRQGDYGTADSLARLALEIDASRYGAAHLSLANNLYVMAIARARMGDHAVADSLHQRELALRRRLGDTDVRIAENLHNLADVKAEQGDYAAAESLEQAVLESYRRHFAGDHPSVAEALNNLAVFTRRLGKYDASEAYYREALAIKREALPEDHPSIATTLSNLGILLGIQGRYDETSALLQEALRIRRARFGTMHPLVANSLRSLATLSHRQGDLEAAEAYAREVLSIEQTTLGESHPNIAQTYSLLGNIQYSRNDYVEAERSFRTALTMKRQFYKDDHDLIGLELHNLGAVLLEQRRYADAESLIKQALNIHRAALGDNHPNMAPTLRNLGRLYGETGRFEEGERLLLQALRLQRETLREDHLSLERTRRDLVNFYVAWGKPEEAAKYGA